MSGPSNGAAAPLNPLTDAALLDQLEVQAAGEGAPTAPSPAEPDMPTAELVGMVLAPAFALLAPNWNVKPDEIKQLSLVYAALLDKYFPDMQNSFGVEIGAVLITTAVFMPRVMAGTPRKIEPPKEAAKPAA